MKRSFTEDSVITGLHDHLPLGYQLITPTNLKTYRLLERL